MRSYLNKAVVEVKAKQASSLTNVVLEDLFELSSNDRFKLRASFVIEVV